jgi:hypothetical protein
LPLYQVDTNDVHDLRLIKNINVGKDRWIRWITSDREDKFCPDLLEFMNVKKVTFHHYLPDGTIKETTFDLKVA